MQEKQDFPFESFLFFNFTRIYCEIQEQTKYKIYD